MSMMVLQSCAATVKDTTIPVTWDSGFTLPELLAAPVELTNIKDIEKLIAAPWYAEFLMSSTKVGESTFSSCQNYFSQVSDKTRTSKENEMPRMRRLTSLCGLSSCLSSWKQMDMRWRFSLSLRIKPLRG